MNPKFIVKQKITALVNRYSVYATDADGNEGDLIAFAQQKRFNIKEKILFYTDESKTDIAFTLRAEKVLDVHGKFVVEDAQGNLLGAFRKAFKKSLLRSTWQILNKDDTPTITVTESSALLATLRRFIGFVPIIGDFGEIIVLFFRYHFRYLDANGAEVGTYRKITLFRDHYLLTFDEGQFNKHDTRLLIAQAVALDALQSR